jgi:hypothetical protein
LNFFPLAQGRPSCTARRLAGPDGQLAPRWYVQVATFDGADRTKTETSGVIDRAAAGASAIFETTSSVTTGYTKRGAVSRVDSNYGSLVESVIHDADGLARRIGYGDIAKTTSTLTYDVRRRIGSVQTYRGPPGLWRSQTPAYSPAPAPDGPPSSFQLLLEDTDISYGCSSHRDARSMQFPGIFVRDHGRKRVPRTRHRA